MLDALLEATESKTRCEKVSKWALVPDKATTHRFLLLFLLLLEGSKGCNDTVLQLGGHSRQVLGAVLLPVLYGLPASSQGAVLR